jgi:hypothetical protein
MLALFEQIRLLKDSDDPVLLLGECGTGKDLVARALHYEGRRAAGPFVPWGPSGLPADLMEPILFGHRRGAFTGAVQDLPGLVEHADGEHLSSTVSVNCRLRCSRSSCATSKAGSSAGPGTRFRYVGSRASASAPAGTDLHRTGWRNEEKDETHNPDIGSGCRRSSSTAFRTHRGMPPSPSSRSSSRSGISGSVLSRRPPAWSPAREWRLPSPSVCRGRLLAGFWRCTPPRVIGRE